MQMIKTDSPRNITQIPLLQDYSILFKGDEYYYPCSLR